MIRSTLYVMLVALVTFGMSASAAFSATLKEKKAMDTANTELQEALKRTNEACGTKLTAKIAAGFSFKEIEEKNVSLSSYCGNGLEGLRMVCSDAAAKASVKKSIASYECYKSKGKREVGLKGKTLRFGVQWDSPNDAQEVKKYLENNLPG
jgi:hypothetical protein